jgi:GNAT superfamily N-acetyltransferase
MDQMLISHEREHQVDGQSQNCGRYPVELEARIELSTGVEVLLRPIRSDDDERIVAFHSRLSFDSVYRRYFSIHPELSTKEVRHLVNVDYAQRFAFVVLDGDDLVAVGRYDRLPETNTADLAFVVADAYQHLGLARRLLAALADAAWQRGIREFAAETLFTNRDMMSVFLHSGFPVKSERLGGDISVHFPIDPTNKIGATADQRGPS